MRGDKPRSQHVSESPNSTDTQSDLSGKDLSKEVQPDSATVPIPQAQVESEVTSVCKIDGIGSPVLRDLFVDWFGVSLRDGLGLIGSGRSGRRFSFRVSEKCEIAIVVPDDGTQISVEGPTDMSGDLVRIAADARARALLNQTGEPVWWQIAFESKPDWTEAGSLHMFRNLGQHKRYEGNWRLGSDALLKFQQVGDKHPPLFPNQTVTVVFRSAGPGHGPFAKRQAITWASVIRAVVALASASPVTGPNLLRPARDSVRAEAIEVTLDSGTPDLNIDGLAVWPAIARMVEAGAGEAFGRLFGALQAFEQALFQRNAGAALIFFVTAIEALGVPNGPWQSERVTRRFSEFLMEACPEAIEEVLKHANYLLAFGRPLTMKRFADHLYKLRSSPVHTGRLGQVLSAPFMDDDGASIRVALTSDVARAAILRFLGTPFSVLTGHPNFDSKITIETSARFLAKLRAAAGAPNTSSTAAWLLSKLEAEYGQ